MIFLFPIFSCDYFNENKMFSIVYSVNSFSVTEYCKQLCIILKNLPLKGFSGMWVRIIYYDRFWETSFLKTSDAMSQMFQEILTRKWFRLVQSKHENKKSQFASIKIMNSNVNAHISFCQSTKINTNENNRNHSIYHIILTYLVNHDLFFTSAW